MAVLNACFFQSPGAVTKFKRNLCLIWTIKLPLRSWRPCALNRPRKVTTASSKEYIVVNHDLASEESFLGFNESAIDMINERFARQLRVGLVDVLRSTPRLGVEKVRTMRYQNFLQALNPPLSVNTVKVEPLRGYSLVVIEPNVIFSSLDNFFGGFGSTNVTIPAGRIFTPTENSIIRILLSLVFGAMKEAYAPILPIEFNHVASEINPQFAQIADDNDLVLVTKLNLTLSDDVEGNIYIVMPFVTLKPIRDSVTQSRADH